MAAATPTYPVGTIAKLLLMSERRVQQLTVEGVIPKAERGRYELGPAVQGYVRYLQERSIAGHTEKTTVDYHVEKARLTKAQADIAEIDLAKVRGEVAPINQVERMVQRAFAEVRAGMRNLPSRVVSQLIGETNEAAFKRVLLGEIDQVLKVLAEADLAGDDEADEE